MKTWHDNSNIGLFVHWGINSGNENWTKGECLYKTFDDFEAAVDNAGWSASKWVEAAVKIKADYITFAIFHSCLGYIKGWKSSIPGTHTTKRDFLGELLEEAAKFNIRVVLYISGDTTGYLRHPSQPWIFPDEYSKYKNDPTINILDDRDWQQKYCRDIINEAIDNYPAISGFWFDGWNNPETNADLFKFIHEKNPELVNFRNNFSSGPGPDEDIMSLESFNKVCDPTFDIASGAWVGPGGKEFCFTIPELSDWFQCYPPGEFNNSSKNDAIRKVVTIKTNGWVPKVGIGPDIGGNFNDSLGVFVNELSAYLSWAGESLLDTVAGGLPAGYKNDGAYVATCHADSAYYIHTLLPPKSNSLIIEDGGMVFDKAINLRTGEAVDFSQENGLVQITCDFNHFCSQDSDTIIRLEAARTRIQQETTLDNYLQALPAEILIQTDGPVNVENGTSSSGCCCSKRQTTPDVCLCLAPAVSKSVFNSLILHQDDTSSTTKGGWAYVANNRAKDYTIYTSDDGENFAKHVSGQLSPTRGVKQINFPAVTCHTIKLCIETAYDTGPSYVKKFANGFWEYPNYETSVIIPEKSIVANGQKIICDDNGDVRIFGAEGNNIYIIGTGAQGVAVDTDGAVLAVVPAKTGKLRINRVGVACEYSGIS